MSAKVSSPRRSSGRLSDRRRRHRRHLLIVLGVLVLACLGAALYGLQHESVRISRVEIFGADPSLAALATVAMQGEYLAIVPRNSTFFFPEDRIRSSILAAHTDIATISLFRSGFTGLTIKVTNRVPIARWCGATRSASSTDNCYVFDDSGFVYATSTETPLVNTFVVYESLATSTASAVGSVLPRAERLPAAFNFARQLATLGPSVSAVVIRGDEIDVHLVSGTRITYVLGQEQSAFTALVSAKSKLNLSDGSLEYIDLRFERKMYLKKKGATVAE